MAHSDATVSPVAQARDARPSLEAFFSYGFRPFFLGAAIHTAVLTTVWLTWIVGTASGDTAAWLPVAGSPFAWHAHEMIYGFASAAIAGFLLTAVPNWTGALPLSGAPLVVLWVVWVAGRIAMAFSALLPAYAAGAVDIAFLPLLAAFAGRQLFVKPALKNLVFLAILLLLALGNAAYHLAANESLPFDSLALMRVALLMVAVMISIIGGRIVPAFTHNWLHLNEAPGPMPRRIGALDVASVLSIAFCALLQATAAPPTALGAAALLAAGLNGLRLFFWRGLATRREPIVWILHVAYAWIVIGLALLAASVLTDRVPASLAVHAFGTGAAGTMIMAVMSRASLGHTGRPLVAPPAVVWAYCLVTAAAVVRVFGPLILPTHVTLALVAAALAWIAAYGLFAAVYAPILTTPRVRMKAAAR